MKKAKRLLALAMACLLAVSLAACGGGGDSGGGATGEDNTGTGASVENGGGTAGLTEVGTMPITEDGLTLTIMTQQIPNIVDISTNKFTLWYQDRTGVEVDWQLVPSDEVETNLNLSLASGDYPDIWMSMGIRAAQEDLYGGEDKIFMPLNDLIDNYMPNFKAILDANPTIKDDLTAMDGNIYCLPSIKEYTHTKWAVKMWINTEWLDTLGLDMPQTTDDFYEALKAFANDDPNGNGVADEIGLSGVIDTGGGWFAELEPFIMNSFIYNSAQTDDGLRSYVYNNSEIDIAVNKEEYREGLRYMNELYEEGLIDPGAFSNTNDQLKMLALNPDAPLLGAAPSGHSAMFLDIVTDPERYAMYDAIAPLEGPNGVRQATFMGSSSDLDPGKAAISTSCANPEAAARWLDGFFDYEVQMCRYWGPEGEAWRVAEDGELGLGGEPALYNTLRPFDESAQNDCWAWLGVEYTPAELQEGMQAVSADTDLFSAEGFEKRLLTITEELYSPYESAEYGNVPKFLRYEDDKAEERNLLSQDLQKHAKEFKVLFITGQASLDDDWDAYVQAFEDMGLARFLEIENEAYQNYIGN